MIQPTFLCLAILLTGLLAARSENHQLPSPTEQPILTIEGNIGVTNVGDKALFDRPMLEEIGMTTVETTTPWFDGRVKFEGVPVDRLMEVVAADGTEVVAVALNDYRTTIPLADFRKYEVILALKRDGEYMSVSDKGPLFIVYPFDSDPDLDSQRYYARSVWQLARLIVR
ncbi:molybdopterin-dependent oxidoreductase [Chelativorans alearense]|uniref:molybdopterin-dependent oxidoreductase n=1 Tax=Chelativorans alearense TaxID=2681495 RepID=UPI001FE65E80|nr:molybdopterin-dependent oxidoreductase [Chelativorans alearense]